MKVKKVREGEKLTNRGRGERSISDEEDEGENRFSD
jgi:hypothetical protein